MPRRVSPNTDKLRYQVMKQAVERLNAMSPEDYFISKDQYQKLLSVLSRFEQIFLSREKLKADPEYLNAQKKAGLFLRHYLVILQMAVERGELPESSLDFYGLKSCQQSIPTLNTSKKIIDWAERVFEGDSIRVANGGKYMTNPSIAVVKVWYEKFMSAHENHRVQIEKYKNNQDFILKLRNEANQIISEFSNELEFAYEELPLNEYLEKASFFGIKYKLSQKEIMEENLPKTASLFCLEEIPVCKNRSDKQTVCHKKAKRKRSSIDLQAQFSFPVKEIKAG